MKYRRLGKTDFKISEVSLGTWQLGGGWGNPFDEELAYKTLNQAIDAGINFIDTADVYSDGLSERAVGKVVRERRRDVIFSTKVGRRLDPHIASGYNSKNIRGYVDDCLTNMKVGALDVVLLHCPPTDVYYYPELFETMDELKKEGKILHYGVSVEKVEEALKAINYSGVEVVQIVFNLFRQRPSELFFKEAKKKDVGIVVRVPLASGLLTGKFSENTKFNEKDHRFFNRDGSAFDRGETFAGVPYSIGLDAVQDLKNLFPNEKNLVKQAIKWITMFDEVSCVIPGARNPEQLDGILAASELPDLDVNILNEMNRIYENKIKKYVHHNW